MTMPIILDNTQTMYLPMTKGHVSTFVIGGLNNAHNACCNVRQVQDSLSGNGTIVVFLTFFMILFALSAQSFSQIPSQPFNTSSC